MNRLHAQSRVTKELYIKTFDPELMETMRRLQATVEMLDASPAIAQQVSSEARAKLLTNRPGEMAEWLKAAVC